jgi:ribosomal protein S9
MADNREHISMSAGKRKVAVSVLILAENTVEVSGITVKLSFKNGSSYI